MTPQTIEALNALWPILAGGIAPIAIWLLRLESQVKEAKRDAATAREEAKEAQANVDRMAVLYDQRITKLFEKLDDIAQRLSRIEGRLGAIAEHEGLSN